MSETMERLSSQNLDKHISRAFKFARKNCKYDNGFVNGVSFPPMEDGKADGLRLVLRALYTMGYFAEDCEGIDIVDICRSIGLHVSYNPYDIYKRHGIVCLRDASLLEDGDSSQDVTYIYYSLGGRDMNSITKFDLGSPARVSIHQQPYKNVIADEWKGRLKFVCFIYADREAKAKRFKGKPIYSAKPKSLAYMRELPKRSADIIHSIPKGARINVYGFTTSSSGSTWYYVEHDGFWGWTFAESLKHKRYALPEQKFKAWTPDNDLPCYVGAGDGFDKMANHQSAKNGEKFRIINIVRGNDDELWANVKDKDKLCYFVKAEYLKELGMRKEMVK